MIKTVVDLKGMKRFKKSKGDSEDISVDLDANFTDGNVNAKAVFRKMMTTTSYAKTFGQKPKTEADFNVLNRKSFLELKYSQILKPNVVAIINRWLKINDQDKFTGRIFNTVREMFTVVKNQLSELPTSHDIFSTQKQIPSASAPRFDKIITNLREDIRKRNLSSSQAVGKAIQDRRMKSYFETVDNKIGAAHRNLTPNRINGFRYYGPAMINTKSYKQEFLKGDQDAIYYCDRNESKPTSYQVTLKGEKTKEPAEILDHNRLSLVQHVIPDPQTMTSTDFRFVSLENDRVTQSKKRFQKSGFESLSPRREIFSHSASKTPTPSRKSRHSRYMPPAGVQLYQANNDFYLRR